MKRFMKLTARQQAVFDQIATGNGNPAASRAMLNAMEDKGLIIGQNVPTYGPTNGPIDRIPLMVRQYSVPLDIHMRWAAWCSETLAPPPPQETEPT